MERSRRIQLDVCIFVGIRNLAWSRRQVGHACDRREAEYIPCQDNPKVATAGKTRDTHVAGTARYTRGQCELAGLRKKTEERARKIRTSIRRAPREETSKESGRGSWIHPPKEMRRWERKRIKSEREWPTTQSRKAIEHRPQGSGTTSEEGPAHGTPGYK